MKFKEKAVKLLINSGYGTFGNPYFPFYDVRVSELITAFARYTLGSVRKSLAEKGCKIVYGDTDSLFVTVEEGGNSRHHSTSAAQTSGSYQSYWLRYYRVCAKVDCMDVCKK